MKLNARNSIRWLPAAMLLALLFVGCFNPTPRSPSPIPTPGQPVVLFPTETAAPLPPLPTLIPSATYPPMPTGVATIETPVIPPGPTDTTAPNPPQPEPPEPAITQRSPLVLQGENNPEDVKEVIEQLVAPPAGGPGWSIVHRGDPTCVDEPVLLMEMVKMMFDGWAPNSQVIGKVVFPNGTFWEQAFPVNPAGAVIILFQAVIGDPTGTYTVILDDGQDHRECTLVYRRAQPRPAVYLIPASPFKPALYIGEPYQALQLYGFAPLEPVRLLVYARTDVTHQYSLVGWQELQVWENGQLLVDLSENAPDRMYIVIGQQTGEVHLLLPNFTNGELFDIMEEVSVLRNH